MAPLLVFVHVAANVVWIGSILAVVVALTAAPASTASSGDMATRGSIAVSIYKKLAMPAFIVSFVAGVGRLILDTGYYFSATKFMHGKLTFAVAVIALHHVIGARAKRVAAGQAPTAGNVGVLGIALFVAALCVAFFAVVKPF
jgi:putative membrane protein